jgi:hypothetical protein
MHRLTHTPAYANCQLECRFCHNLTLCGGWNCLPSPAVWSCEALERGVLDKRLQFHMIEQPLREVAWPGSWLCPQFTYMTVLRDPISRLLSEARRHAHRYRLSPDELIQQWLAGTCTPRHSSVPRCVYSQEGMVLHWDMTTSFVGTPFVSNYQARMLLGPGVFLKAKLTQDDQRRALCLLHRFSLVVPLEELGGALDSGILAELVVSQATLGAMTRRGGGSLHHQDRNAHFGSAEGTNGTVNLATLQMLQEANRLDHTLLAYARDRWSNHEARTAARCPPSAADRVKIVDHPSTGTGNP